MHPMMPTTPPREFNAEKTVGAFKRHDAEHSTPKIVLFQVVCFYLS